MSDILSEKYRPKTLDDVIGNKDTIETLKLILTQKNMPHLLFTGTPGTGKTTCAKIISKELSTSILELNASDDRGIDIVRERIKTFASKKSSFKIIILDEADAMTTAAQQALRRIMETCNNTRFILICNTFSQIHEPIQSRCAVLKFDRIGNAEIKERLDFICESEKLQCETDLLIEICEGDMRQAINVLQNCVISDEKSILKIIGIPSPKIIDQIVGLLMDKNVDKAVELFDGLWSEKYDPVDMIRSFFRSAKNLNSYELLKVIGPVHVRIVEGVNTKLQFYALFHDISNIK